MRRKMAVVALLVVIFLWALVVEGVSQPTSPPSVIPGPAPSHLTQAPAAPIAIPPPVARELKANFSAVQPPQQEWTFEQLVEALKGVRARQKELLAQEADLLAQMEKKVEEKRHDLGRAEATLQRLQENGRVFPRKHIGELKEEKTTADTRDDKR